MSAFSMEMLKRLKHRVACVSADIKGTVKLHQGNAPNHTAFIVTNFLARSNTPVALRLTYSRDLALCDFILFLRHKRELNGKHWKSVENKEKHVTRILTDIRVEDFQGAFQTWQICFESILMHRAENYEVYLAFVLVRSISLFFLGNVRYFHNVL